MIGRSGERGSGISVLAARHDDDDDLDMARRSQFAFNNCCYLRSHLFKKICPVGWGCRIHQLPLYSWVTSS